MLVLNQQNFDPTRTTLLRRRMTTELHKRFNHVKTYSTFNRSVIESTIVGSDASLLPYTQFAFTTGVKRSFAEARKALASQGNNLQGAQQEFLRLMHSATFIQTSDLNQRIHDELLNVAHDAATRIKRVLADGKSASHSQQLVRAAINEQLGISFRRAEAVIQTELTRCHADGQLAAFEKLGIQKVGVLCEWTNPNRGTSAKGNPSPCRVCKPLVGVTLTLREAKGLIPRHPRCMCSFTLVANRTEDQIRQRREIERAIKRSVRAEGNQTGWRGATRKIAPRR